MRKKCRVIVKEGLNKIYEEFKTYTDLKAATEDLRNLGWIKGKRRKEKQLFRCKRGCPKALYCMLTNNLVTAYVSTCQHQHNESKYYLPPKVVNECFDKNQNKPGEILNQIRSQQAPQLIKKQLNNYKYRNTRKRLGHSAATLQEIIKWC